MTRVTDPHQEEIELTKYSGATADKLHHMANYYIDTNKPDNLIIVAGLNDILNERRKKGTANCGEVADRVLNIGRTARTEGVGRVCISEILKPRFRDCHENINDTNHILRSKCESEGFIFVSQSNIGVSDLGDNLHVSREGNDKLKHNILSQCYTYDKSY
jgi:hypothetical protein